ncbi:MAG: UDP-N-acetylmuramoyl-tripeptide--D-alanyl-D-alanine ligase [Defluviitaleaceae bacterium]|nr:UDP-N-acetylmuramoyl-tripeptide--D-alanyl-D-alanine ligase [Defluviitaleaceae bacterium]
MRPIPIDDVVKAVGGKVLHNADTFGVKIYGVTIDSRKDVFNSLFVPLKGEHNDGHNFINQAFESGAVCSFTERDSENIPGKVLIKVDSTNEALKKLAEYYRSLFSMPIVAITGSSGKTTTKELIASVLAMKYKVLKTEGNYNNEIGLPLTVFNIDDSTECAVLEMGMNNAGEIHNLSKIGKPDICIITNIGVAHIMNLGSREGILKAKSEIFDYMQPNGLAILNGGDNLLASVKPRLKNVITFGFESTDEVYADNVISKGLDGVDFVLKSSDSQSPISMKTFGKHAVLNALAAAAVGLKLGVPVSDIKKALEVFNPPAMRSSVIKGLDNKLTVINDAYNANPDSVCAAIDVLSEVKGNRVCILGDMAELGDFSEGMHKDVGEYAAKVGIEHVVCVGDSSMSGKIYEAVHSEYSKRSDKFVYYFATQDEMIKKLPNIIHEGDIVLVKASRSSGLEVTVDALLSMQLRLK